MRWNFVPGDPTSTEFDDLAYLDHILIESMEGEDTNIHYLNDIAAYYADRNIRHGFDIRIAGSCAKGPQGINWDTIRVYLEETGELTGLYEHLLSLWGPERQELGEVGGRSLSYIN